MLATPRPHADPTNKKLFHFNHLPPRPAWHANGIGIGVRPLGEQEMNGTLRATLTALAVLGCAVSTAAAMSRIKDLASIEGVRQNQLLGYGLVVGLNGTGDTLNNTPFTKQSL
jgi:Flagellar P-ring protein